MPPKSAADITDAMQPTQHVRKHLNVVEQLMQTPEPPPTVKSVDPVDQEVVQPRVAVRVARKPLVHSIPPLQDLKSPVMLALIGALTLSLLGNLAQLWSGPSAGQLENRLDLERLRWDTERTAMQEELDRLRQQVQLTSTDRARISAEIDQIRMDVRVYEEAIFKTEMDRVNAARRQKQYELAQKYDLAAEQQRIVAAIDGKLMSLRAEKTALLTQRDDLQAQLTGPGQ